MNSGRNIAFIGAGNVATHLVRALAPAVQAVLSRTYEHAVDLAQSCGVPCASSDFSDLSELRPDIIIISVADSAVADIVNAIGPLDWNPLVLHTSGTVGKESLAGISTRTGVLYPLQTFSRSAKVDISEVPFFIETADSEDLPLVEELAKRMSTHVRYADAERRRVLHVAGVFASNFPNIMFEIVQDVLATAGYPLETVRPLVYAMVDKAFAVGPHAAQTGPARRGDRDVIASHAAMLPEDKAEIYNILSNYIIASHEQD